VDKIDELLTRGVDKIYPSKEELEKILKSEKKLKLYQGFDPTGTQMHIGHMMGLRKLKQFQDLGHQVIFLIGDATGQAGDPSGKTSSRETFLSQEELLKNASDYVVQAGKILRFEGENKVEIQHNSEWFKKLDYSQLLILLGQFSVQQLLERDLFQERLKNNEPINLRAFIYPILQAYDSVAMKVDLELGGTDQTFNMLMGRQLAKQWNGGKEKLVMTTPLLTDLQGVKIGKTEGNVIALTDKPEDLYGKIMALSDDIIVKGLEYLTDVPMDQVKEIERKLNAGENPVESKKLLAFEVTKQLNSNEDAEKAQDHFEKTVQTKEVIPFVPGLVSQSSLASLSTVLVEELRAITSNSEYKRLVDQRGIRINGQVVTNPSVGTASGDLVSVGKRDNFKIEIKK